jgi:hypothetical protein
MPSPPNGSTAPFFEEDDVVMQVAGTMIGAAGNYTISAVVRREGEGRYHSTARTFDHPDPAKTLPSGTAARHVVTAEGASLQEATRRLEDALATLLGRLDWARWRYMDDPQDGQK